MPSRPLPQEILDHIVDWVARDTPESLKDVASTSRHFLERSRSYLFRNIYFAEPLWMAPVTWKILHRNPSIFKYSRRMIIRPKLPAFRVPDSAFQDALGHVGKMEGVDMDIRGNHARWAKLGVFELFSDIAHLSAYIDDNVPLDVFYPLPKLQELRISYQGLQRRPWGRKPKVIKEEDIVIPPWKLKSLHFHPTRPLAKIPLPLMISPKLRRSVYGSLVHLSLKIEDNEAHTFMFSKVIPACETSPLETLQLWYGDEYDYAQKYVTAVPDSLVDSAEKGLKIPTLTLLRYLSIALHSLRPTGDNSPRMPRHQADFIHALLDQTIQPSLEVIELRFSWDTRNRSHPCLASEHLIVHNHGWERLDALFTSRALYPYLHAVRVTTHLEDELRPGLYVVYHSTDESELGWTLREQMRAALPSAAEDAALLVDVGERETRRAFDWIAKPMLDGAWERRPTR